MQQISFDCNGRRREHPLERHGQGSLLCVHEEAESDQLPPDTVFSLAVSGFVDSLLTASNVF